ncbi:SDR family oxidoreductase [bacterium 1XD21-13]|nr:SDR family oxidoreductase [bacterium 1XD21-13]
MRALILGINGMLGQSIFRRMALNDIEVLGVDRSNADWCFDLQNDERLERTISYAKPDIVINTAAIVSLENCEGNPGNAYCINTRIPGVVSLLCKKYGSYFVQISTDHFFTGDRDAKHRESDKVSLVNEYARTKYLGEILAMENENSLILRTNIVGFRGRGVPTFLEWAIEEIVNHKKMTLYTDFYTSSIHTNDFADILMDVLVKRPTGIYNLSSDTVANKKEFIVKLSKELFGYTPEFVESSVKSLNGAKRAESLGLDNSKLEQVIGRKMPDLNKTMESIKKEYLHRRTKNVL